MEPEEADNPTELTPRSKKRKQTAEAKAAAKLADPDGWKKKRREQERQRLINKKAREAIAAVRQAAEASTPNLTSTAAEAPQVRASDTSSSTVTTIDHATEMRKAFEHSIPLAVPAIEQALEAAAAELPPAVLDASRPDSPAPEARTAAEELASAQRKIADLEFDKRMLQHTLDARDSELANFADALGRAVREAEDLRDSCYSQRDRSLDDTVDSRGIALHVQNSNSCNCPGCMGLMFLEVPLRFKALYHARMRREQQ